ncbi:MAG: hypothetical protein ABJN42_21000 [Roseibium sp.]|uniref:hypothetical protein n=1 Tax=Roseibium sp. TaxID=1936156 RepID=UPI003296F84B
MKHIEDQLHGCNEIGDIYLVDRGAARIAGTSGANFFHLMGGRVRIRNFDTSKDHLDFGPAGMSMLRSARIVGANISMESGEGLTVTLLDAAAQYPDLESAMMISLPAYDRLQSLAPYLSGTTRDEVADMALNTLTATGSTLFGDDPQMIEACLPARASWEINNITHPKHTQDAGHPRLDRNQPAGGDAPIARSWPRYAAMVGSLVIVGAALAGLTQITTQKAYTQFPPGLEEKSASDGGEEASSSEWRS